MRCLCCRELQGREWIGGVRAMPSRKIQHSLGRHVCVDVHRLSHAHVVANRERVRAELHLHQGLYRAGWCRVYVLYRGDLQGREWIGGLRAMPPGKVFNRNRKCVSIHVPRLSSIFICRCWRSELQLRERIHQE